MMKKKKIRIRIRKKYILILIKIRMDKMISRSIKIKNKIIQIYSMEYNNNKCENHNKNKHNNLIQILLKKIIFQDNKTQKKPKA